MRTKRFGIQQIQFGMIALLLMLALGQGCSFSKPKTDPLAGWHSCEKVPQTVEADVQHYIDGLSPYQREHIVFTDLYELNGQYAVRLTLALNGDDWNHIIIWDKNYKRIKVIKFIANRYVS